MTTSFWRYQMPAIIWTILTFVLSSLHTIKTPDLGFDFQDKLHHFVYYSIYGVLLARAFFYQNSYPRLRRSFLWAAVIIGTAYGLTDEFHQYFVPGREMDFWDFVADSLGVFTGAYLFSIRYSLKRLVPVSRSK